MKRRFLFLAGCLLVGCEATTPSRLYARLGHAIRYRTDGSRDMETDYDPNGSPSKWISYSSDGLHEALVVKQSQSAAKPCLVWVAVPDANGEMRAYGLASGVHDSDTSLRLSGPLDVNEPL